MIRRLYIHNFRCLENFELPISGHSSVLLIGRNGAGKSTVGHALEILQKIARGTNRVGDLLRPTDLARGRAEAPMRFEIEVALDGNIYKYAVAFEFPKAFKELRVFEEALIVDGKPLYTRELAQVRLTRAGSEMEASFRIDWHVVALPIIQRQPSDDPLYLFKNWLANSLVVRPTPSLIRGNSEQETLHPNPDMTDFGAWFSGLLASAPSAYTKIDEYLKEMMPDLHDVKNLTAGRDSRSLIVEFANEMERVTIRFGDLSDGEKLFMIYAMVIATNAVLGPLLCFWDEPDNYLAPSEVRPSVMALRRAFKSEGQLIVTSHNPEAIHSFSDENTLFLYRNSHLEPAIARSLDKLRDSGDISGDFVNALIRGDVEP
jgi:predicted ATPase